MMRNDATEMKLVTLGELHRLLNLAPQTVRKAIQRGRLKPDHVAGRVRLFNLARLEEIMALFNPKSP
jgi:hypothetical protein